MGADDPELPTLRADQLVVLYDGVCGMCNRLVQFLLRRDRDDRLRFAPLQSDLGRALVERHGGDPDEVSTMYLVSKLGTDDERAHRRGPAAVRAIAALGGGWRLFGVLRIVPALVLNLGYSIVAKLRYRISGRLGACPVPSAESRDKFIAL